jgi:hypothetical protein
LIDSGEPQDANGIPDTDEDLSGLAERLREHGEALSGAGSRYWNSPGYAAAMDHAEALFQSWGYRTRRQPFEVGTVSPQVCWNLIADGPRDASEGEEMPTAIVAAHLDCIAPGAESGGPAPGADDNASGCAIVLEAARTVAENSSSRRVRFVLFGAEEIGIYGSAAYVAAMLHRERKALREVWVLDQVGLNTRPAPTLKLEGYKTHSGALMSRAERFAPSVGLGTERTYRPYGSDHMPFLKQRIPTLLLIQPDDEEDPLNHTAEDLPGRLDYGYMARICALLCRCLGNEDRGEGRRKV